MDIDEAARTATHFIEEYIIENNGFSTTDSPDDFRLAYQEVVPEGQGLLVVFGVQPTEDPDDPSPEVKALADACIQAMLQAHPALAAFPRAVQYLA